MGFGFFNQHDTKQFPLEISDIRTKLSCLQDQAKLLMISTSRMRQSGKQTNK